MIATSASNSERLRSIICIKSQTPRNTPTNNHLEKHQNNLRATPLHARVLHYVTDSLLQANVESIFANGLGNNVRPDIARFVRNLAAHLPHLSFSRTVPNVERTRLD